MRILPRNDATTQWPSTARYPWDSWLDIAETETGLLTEGHDFHIDAQQFRTQLHAAARRRQIPIQTRLIYGPPPAVLFTLSAATAISGTTHAIHPTCTVCGKPLSPGAVPYGECYSLATQTFLHKPLKEKDA